MPEQVFWPVLNGGRLSSPQGMRKHPTLRGMRPHNGIDIKAPTGTGVVAPISGTVISAGNASSFGNLVQIRGVDGNTYRFAHLNNYSVQQGMRVTGGQLIGTVGSTGRSTGPHLHFEVRDATGKVLNAANSLAGAKTLEEGIRSGGNIIDDLTGSSVVGDAFDLGIDVLSNIPGFGGILGQSAKALGVGGTGSGIWGGLQSWISDTGIFQRIAIALVALIFIAAALFLLGKGEAVKTVGQTARKALE